VEIRINGVNQVAVHPKIGLSFSQVLRAFMRQDPDVMMVGEIRDAETADIAVKAAQTGHLVLSTLHAKSTLEAFQRLQSLGISAYNLATSLTLVMAQRLVRKLCRVCAISLSMLDPNTQFFQANPEGCSSCHRGYRGRFAIFEVLEITPALQQAIFQQSSQQELTVIAEQLGWRTLYQEGLEAVAAGMTSLDELERVVTA
jgi:type IV pilus assembly protein PilB